MAHLVDPDAYAAELDAEVQVPRGEARKAVAELASALAERRPRTELEPLLEAAAEHLPDGDRALALRAALPVLARTDAVQARVAQLEPLLQQVAAEDRPGYAHALAPLAAPALGLDVALMKDDGYEFVAIYPPEGSEGVDIAGRAAVWLTKRMTMESQTPRTAMRRFFAIAAEEIEVEHPLSAELLDRLAATPPALHAHKDDAFVALARGLVDEAIRERGFPW